jgi:hypothetical protein
MCWLRRILQRPKFSMFTHESFVGPKGSDIMKNLIRLEEIALFLFSIFLFSLLDLRWWWFPALLLVPDLSMAGYTMNTKIGAIMYNVIHHRAVALLLYTIGEEVHVSRAVRYRIPNIPLSTPNPHETTRETASSEA